MSYGDRKPLHGNLSQNRVHAALAALSMFHTRSAWAWYMTQTSAPWVSSTGCMKRLSKVHGASYGELGPMLNTAEAFKDSDSVLRGRKALRQNRQDHGLDTRRGLGSPGCLGAFLEHLARAPQGATGRNEGLCHPLCSVQGPADR